MDDHYSLGLLERVTRDFIAPHGPFDPREAWENTYAVYALFLNNPRAARFDVPMGSLRISRTPLAGGMARLKVEYEKRNRDGGPHRIAGELECATDDLATPARWQFTAELSPPPQLSVQVLRTRHTMDAVGRRLQLSSQGFKSTLPRPAAFCSLWTLCDAVQRLPRTQGAALRFTFFDLNFAPKKDHLLRYRESTEQTYPKTPESPVRLHAFEQLGEGLVSSIYWTGDNGRLLFFASALHAYVLHSAQAKEAA
jgi:hypothetical protein